MSAVSDGTMRCPIPSPDDLPCQKLIPKGWTADEGHSGGHWWQSDESFTAMLTSHYDASRALRGLPYSVHAPSDCPGPPTCIRVGDTVITREPEVEP